jgi:fused signal recognition particle receptor
LPPAAKPHVILVVGVNGSGKTTTIGKLATQYAAAGKRVLLAAGDTYRAAAADQLQIWAERSGAEIVRLDEGADPSAVAFDAMRKATSGDFDVVIVDTAGRLQTARPLMEQLAKVRRVIAKQVPDAPHETLLVVDGTMGQNALSQARLFGEAAPLTGVVVTKLDGTAKGGVVVALRGETGVPIRWVGVGERAVDLKTFDAQEFVDALLPAD